MKLFRQEKEPTAIPSRLKKMSTHSLYDWMETTIMGLGAAFDQWRYHDTNKEQFVEQLAALNTIWQELQQRVDKD